MMAERRTSFVFPPDAARKLAAIRELSYLNSEADLLKAAISVYETLLGLTAGGWRVFVRDRQGREWAYSPYLRFTYPGIEDRLASLGAPGPAPMTGKSFFFSGDAVKRIEAIKRASYVSNNADVVRACLSAYRTGHEEPFSPHRPFVIPDLAVLESPTASAA